MSTVAIMVAGELIGSNTLYDYALTHDGFAIASHGRVPLLQLSRAIEQNGADSMADVVLILPAIRMSWHLVQLPLGTLTRGWLRQAPAAHARAVLEELLSERLLDDPQLLHFSLAQNARDGATSWVGVCDRVWLTATIANLEQAGYRIARIAPQFWPEAYPGVLHVVENDGASYVVRTSPSGVTVLPLTHEVMDILACPVDTIIVAMPAAAELAVRHFGPNISEQSMEQLNLKALASDWNFSQFELSGSDNSSSWKNIVTQYMTTRWSAYWPVVRLALPVVLMVNIVGLSAWAWSERIAIEAQRMTLHTLFADEFPDVGLTEDPYRQMSHEVMKLEQSTGAESEGKLEKMLSAFGSTVKDGLRPTSIDFVAEELRLKGIQLTPDEMAEISSKLKPLGYAIEGSRDNFVISVRNEP